MLGLYLAFFLSGFPALLYQLVWQRSLFTFFGVNIESISVVVTAFMLGLGFGSLTGGWLSKNQRISPLLAFAILELAIACYGLISLPLINLVGVSTAGSPALVVFLVAFALVLIPTLCMGATLPLLTAYLVKRDGNVGKSVGALYFVNTLGSSLACFFAAIWLFANYGNSGTVNFAVAINLIVGTTAIAIWATLRNSASNTSFRNQDVGATQNQILSMPVASVLVGLIGFISLSYEIIWARIFMFVSSGWALAFPLLLGSFLFGIAFGSAMARFFCHPNTSSSQLKILGWFILGANLVGYSALPILSRVILAGESRAIVFLAVVALSSAMLGATLPLVAYYGVKPNSDSGRQLSHLYMANIVGAAAGSLFTGFILMEYLDTSELALALATIGTLLSAFLFWKAGFTNPTKNVPLLSSFIVLLTLFLTNPALFQNFYAKLLLKRDFDNEALLYNIENRSGIVSVTKDNVVWGGGGYDGRFNIDPVKNTNSILRAYSVSAFHSSPKKVLMFGLASGSWAQVLANHPDVESLTIIEINEGYISIVKNNPIVASVLDNPKVEIIKDDGRRWLNANSDRKFDAMVHNITLHWRFYASNLLSKEFIELTLDRLEPEGVSIYNGTCSPSAYKTAAINFPHSLRFLSLAIGSANPIVADTERLREVLKRYNINGKSVLDMSDTTHAKFLDDFLDMFENRSQIDGTALNLENCHDIKHAVEDNVTIIANAINNREITDNNMGDEWLRQPWKSILKGKERWKPD